MRRGGGCGGEEVKGRGGNGKGRSEEEGEERRGCEGGELVEGRRKRWEGEMWKGRR